MEIVVASRERFADAVRSLERARSLTQILDTLVSVARTDAARADIWLIRGGRLHQWRSPGSDGAGADHVPAGSVSEKCEHAPSRPAPPQKNGPNSQVVPREARLLGAREPLLRRAPRSLDEGGVIAEAARTEAVTSADGTIAVPIAIAGHVVAILFADLREPGTQNLELGTGNRERTLNLEPRTSNLEFLTRYAARCLEALTAFKAARALTQRPAEPDAAGSSPPAIDEASAEEDTSARRYARLLISEIKLYHESAVVDGCRDRDLATRLGGEIARARVMYEQRVPPHVRRRVDFFHDEVVRTLANGDASLLEFRS
jgi:hypothetical protein